jgi:hypothetical protein
MPGSPKTVLCEAFALHFWASVFSVFSIGGQMGILGNGGLWARGDKHGTGNICCWLTRLRELLQVAVSWVYSNPRQDAHHCIPALLALGRNQMFGNLASRSDASSKYANSAWAKSGVMSQCSAYISFAALPRCPLPSLHGTAACIYS